MVGKELELWDGVRQGNTASFSGLYEHFSLDLFRYGYRISSDRASVQDAVQELFLELWNKRGQLTQAHSPRFYLYRSLRNRLIRYSESNRFVLTADGFLMDEWFAEEPDTEADWIEKEETLARLGQLHAALNRLSARQQEAIQLRYYHDFSSQEIARIMDMNEQSVRNLLYRALRQLRSEFPLLSVFLSLFFVSYKV